MTLQNFETNIGTTILQRGKEYYNNGCVVSLEETGDNIWTSEVEGSENYTVEVTLKNNGITDYICDCPYDGDTCKHAVAVFFALRKEVKEIGIKPKKGSKKDAFETLLQTITLKEYQDFISAHAVKNKHFKTEFELFFADKDSRIDVEKKYTELVKKLIRKYTNRGFIDYRGSLGLYKDVKGLLATGLGYIGKSNFRDALLWQKPC